MPVTVDTKAIKKGVGRVVQTLVGDLLAEDGPEGSKTPAVYLGRGDAPYGRYPFIIIDLLGRPKSAGWGLNSWVDDAGVQWFANTYNYMVSVQVFDKGRESANGQNAFDIIHTFADKLTQVPAYRRLLKQEAGALLENIDPVEDTTNSSTEDGHVFSYRSTLYLTAQSLISIEEVDNNFIEEVDLDIPNLGININSTEDETVATITPVIDPYPPAP